VLRSSDETFDCSFLDSLRSQGYFQGTYECQGKTINAGAVRKTADVKPFSRASVTSVSMLGLFAGVTLAFIAYM
jgi:hypothetical protein